MPDVLADSLNTTAVEVNGDALAAPTVPAGLAVVRRRSVVAGVIITVMVAALAGGGVWWHRAVTADPGLEFQGPNVYRDGAATDVTGIDRTDNKLGTEVDVAFVPGGRLFVTFGLYNGGPRDVRIEESPAWRFYYWALERMSLSTDPDDGWVGTARNFAWFEPFTLRRGETRDVRLEFRLADCDPATLQPGGYSSLRGVTLRYRTLGISRSRVVPFGDSVIALQAMGVCRHPLVDRQP